MEDWSGEGEEPVRQNQFKRDINARQEGDRTIVICDQCQKEFHLGCFEGLWPVPFKTSPQR